MDFSVYTGNNNNIIVPVSDSYLYEYCTNCSTMLRRTSSEKRDKSRDEDKQHKKNKKKTISRRTTVKQKYTTGERLLSVC
jgi:hypothetical protein